MSFDTIKKETIARQISLNPFRAGRCLSTLTSRQLSLIINGLNPFRAGRCLSTQKSVKII